MVLVIIIMSPYVDLVLKSVYCQYYTTAWLAAYVQKLMAPAVCGKINTSGFFQY